MYENLSRNFLIQLADGLTYLSLRGNFNQISNSSQLLLLETVITFIGRNIATHSKPFFLLKGSQYKLHHANNDAQCIH